MEKAKPINLDEIREYQEELNNDFKHKIATNALYSNKINDVAFVGKSRINHVHEFTNDYQISSSTVTDQKQSGRCWMFATLNVLRHHFCKENEISNFEFSQSYCVFWEKFERANAFLEKMISHKHLDLDSRENVDILENGFGDGGYFEMSANIIKKYGLVPSYVMPDNFNVSNTLVLNKLINLKLKKAALELRVTEEREKITEIKHECLSEVYYLLTLIYGTPPEKFDLEYFSTNKKKEKVFNSFKNITPLELYKRTKVNLDDYVTLIHVPLKQYPFNQIYELKNSYNVYEKGNMTFLNVDRETMNIAINAMLEYKQPMWFACDVSYYFDLQSGIWDDEMYDYETLFDTEFNHEIDEMLAFNQFSPNHAMTMVGCHWDDKEYKTFVKTKISKNKTFDLDLLKSIWAERKIKKLKVENSWGNKHGNKGYFIITDSWKDKYLTEVVVNKNILKKFVKEHKHLDSKSFANFKFKPVDSLTKKEDIIYHLLFDKGLNTKPIQVEHWSVFFSSLKGK